MAAITTINGRRIPFTDWEGDDFVPHAPTGKYVTCMDTATGRAVAFSTNGRVDKDGEVYRAAVHPPDPNGVNFDQMEKAVKVINPKLDLVHHTGWTKANVTPWLKAGKGLIVTGIYSSIPRMYRFQANGDFSHAMFITHFNKLGTLMRLFDPLDPRLDRRGRTVPTSILWPFLDDLSGNAGYVPLHPLWLSSYV